MRILIVLCAVFLSGLVYAKAPYDYMAEKDAAEFAGKAVLQTEKGWFYVGDIKDGKPHGNGVKISDKGMVLYGEWVEGELEGEGAIYTPAPFDALKAGRYMKNTLVGDGVHMMGGEVYQGPHGEYGLPDGTGVCIKQGVEKGIEKPCRYKKGAKVE